MTALTPQSGLETDHPIRPVPPARPAAARAPAPPGPPAQPGRPPRNPPFSLARPASPAWKFLRHLLEMTLAMVAGMLLLGPIWQAIGSGLGAGEALRGTEIRVLEASVTMVVGMAVWMRVRQHRWPIVAEMSAAMSAPLILLLVPFWIGVLPAAAVLHGGHLLMVPAMAVAMLARRQEYLEHRPLAWRDRTGFWAAVARRWPIWLALLVTFELWLTPAALPPYLMLVLPLAYLLIGSWRRQLGRPGMLAVQLGGLVAYLALVLVAQAADPDLARYLVGAGWLAHAAWDLVHLRLRRVVPGAYAEFCAVIDTVIGVTIIVLL